MGHAIQGPDTEGIVLSEATHYVRKLIPPAEGHLARLEKLAEERHVPIIAPEVAEVLAFLVRQTRPTTVLEVGTAMGYSASVMLMASTSIKRLYTIERRYDRYQEAQTLFAEAGLSSRVEQIVGDAQQVLAAWETPIDMVFIDGAKSHYETFVQAVIKALKPGGIIVCDNALFRGMVVGSEQVHRRDRTLVRRMDEFLHHWSQREDCHLLLWTIHDGIAIIEKGSENE